MTADEPEIHPKTCGSPWELGRVFKEMILGTRFLHFSLGVDLPLSYWSPKEWRIHIPTNGANLGFSGAMRD